MAFGIPAVNTFEGSVSSLISVPIEKADTFRKNLVVIETDIKEKRALPRFEVTGATLFQNRVLTPSTSVGDFGVVSEKYLIPADMMLFIDNIDIRAIGEQYWDFKNKSLIAPAQAKLLDRELDPTMVNLITYNVLAKAAFEIDRQLWMGRVEYGTGVLPATKGDTTVANVNLKFYDGFLKRCLLIGSGAIPVPSPSALSSANMITKMEQAVALYMSLPTRDFTTLAFSMNPFVYSLYLADLRTKGLATVGQQVANEMDKYSFAGIPIKTVSGITNNNTFFLGCFGVEKSILPSDMNSGNFYVGMNNPDDMENLEFSKKKDGSEAFYLKALLKLDTNIAMPEFVVYHTTITN